MRRIKAFEWISLDGVFDADPEYFSKWFLPYQSGWLKDLDHSNSRATCIKITVEEADAMLLGSDTYKMLAPYWSVQQNDDNGPAQKLNSMPKYAVSTTIKKPIWQNTKKVIGKDVEQEIAKLKQHGEGYILIFGSGILVASLMKAGLLDEFRFLVHPYIMNKGRRLFDNGLPEAALKLVDSKLLNSGILMLDYNVNY